MREVVLDTETTGLEPEAGHRVVEIGAVELVHRMPTGRTYHQYLDPERDVPPEAERVHGLTRAFLSRFPTFPEIADDFLAFLADSPLVIHNAGFDLRFLNAELARCGRPPLDPSRAVDTLVLAQRRFPGQSNSLEALCRRLGVDDSKRGLHGALLDAQLLAEVYVLLVGGRQPTLALEPAANAPQRAALQRRYRPPRPHAPSEAELAAHAAFLREIDNPLWLREEE